MVAVAAALWLAYLVPNWLRRQQYLATERNAVRLQQTIRVLAETAEIPEDMRALAPQGPVAVGRPVARSASAERDARLAAARRIRRSRAVATLVLIAAIVAGIAQIGLLVTTGPAIGSWVVLGLAGAAGVSSVRILVRLAARTRPEPEVTVSAPRTTSSARPTPVPVAEPAAPWTPVPVPKPMYLSRAEVRPAPVADASRELRVAAAEAEASLRQAQASTAVPVQASAQDAPAVPEAITRPVAVPSRFASMGVVQGGDGSALPDIDAVLARRRAAG